MYESEDVSKHLLLSIGEDITERKQAEEALRLSSLVTNTSMSAIFTSDLKGIISYANSSAAKNVGV